MSAVVNRLLIVGVLLSLSSTSAHAQVYKCQRPSGVISYQDKPCVGSKPLKTITVPSTPSVAPSVPTAPTTPAGPTSPPAPASATPATGAPNAAQSTLAPTGSAPAAQSALPEPTAGSAAFRCERADGSSYFVVGKLPRGQTGADGRFVADQCGAAEVSALCAWYAEQKTLNSALQTRAKGIELTRAKREGQRLAAIHANRCRG